jgi:hypothetical protein
MASCSGQLGLRHLDHPGREAITANQAIQAPGCRAPGPARHSQPDIQPLTATPTPETPLCLSRGHGHVICSGMSDAARANSLVAAAFRFRVSDGTLCGDMCTTQTPWSRRQSVGGLQITDMGGLAVSDVWLPTRTDGLLCYYGGIVNAGSRACVESTHMPLSGPPACAPTFNRGCGPRRSTLRQRRRC